MARAMATRTCRICGRVDPPGAGLTYGRCGMCAIYWRRHGVERRPGPPGGAARGRRCTHCGRSTMRPRRGRCNACNHHWRRYGVERSLAPRPPRLCLLNVDTLDNVARTLAACTTTCSGRGGAVSLGVRPSTVAGAPPGYGPMPTPAGLSPTAIGVPTTVLVVVSITVTVLLLKLAT